MAGPSVVGGDDGPRRGISHCCHFPALAAGNPIMNPSPEGGENHDEAPRGA